LLGVAGKDDAGPLPPLAPLRFIASMLAPTVQNLGGRYRSNGYTPNPDQTGSQSYPAGASGRRFTTSKIPRFSTHPNLRITRPPTQIGEETLQRCRFGDLRQGILVRALRPEGIPGRKQLVEGTGVRLTPWPAHFQAADWRFVQVASVPVARQAATEAPAPVDPLVVVPVQHLHDHPLGTGLMFVLRIDHARGVIGIAELDDVLSQVVGGAVELLAHGFVQPRLEVRAAALVAAHPHVRGEAVGHGVHVAHVQGQGVLAGQLADRVQRLQPVDALKQAVVVLVHQSSTVYRSEPRPPSTARLAPVTYDASSLARNTMALANSTGRPTRFIGMTFSVLLRVLASANMPAVAGVSTTPGMITLQRTLCGAPSLAAARLKLITAALAAE